MSEKNYYAVSVGRRTGIFQTWTLCNKQVNKYNGSTYEGFEKLEESINWLISHGIERDTIEVFDKKGDEWSLDDFMQKIDNIPLYVDLSGSDGARGGVTPPVNNALLAYTVYSMQSGTAEKITSVVRAHFTIDDVIIAKDKLWDAADQSIIGPRKRRRDGTIKSEKHSHTEDVVTALYQLDAADKMPHITLSAMDLGCIPRSHPEELNEISMADRLNRMEERLSALTEVVDRTVGINMTLKDQMNAIQQDSHASFPILNVPNRNHGSYSGAVKSPPSNPTNVHTQAVTSLRVGGNTVQSSTHAGDTRRAAPDEHRQRPAGVRSISAIIHQQHLSTSRQSLDASSVASNANTNNDDFHQPSRAAKRKRRQENRRKRIVQGSRPAGSIRGAPEPRRDAFIYRVLSDTITEMMRQHIDDMGVNIESIDCVSNPNAKFKSFKVTTAVSNFNELFKPEMWPAGICVRKYIPPRRGENTD